MRLRISNLLPAERQANDSRIVNVPQLKFYNGAYDDYWTLDLNEDLIFNSPSGNQVLVLSAGGGDSSLKGQWTLQDQDYTSDAADLVVNVGHLKSFVQNALANLPAQGGSGRTVTDQYMDQTELVLQFSDGTRLRTDLSFLLLEYQVTDNLREGLNPKNLWFTEARVLATPLTGYTQASTNRALTATDTVGSAFGVLEKRLGESLSTWFSSTSTATLVATNSFYIGTINPAIINFVQPNTTNRIDLATTSASLNYNLTHNNAAADYAIVDFTNGTTVDGKTRILLFPGDYVVFIRNASKSCVTVQAGNTKTTRGLLYVSPTTKQAVSGGTFASGELQGTQPAESVEGMKFCDANYRYEFMQGMNQGIVWVRLLKSM